MVTHCLEGTALLTAVNGRMSQCEVTVLWEEAAGLMTELYDERPPYEICMKVSAQQTEGAAFSIVGLSDKAL